MKIEANPSHERVKLFEGDSWTLPTDITLIDAAGEAFLEKLAKAGWNTESDKVFFLHLGFSEALANAIAHGNLGIVKPEGDVQAVPQLGVLALAKQKAHPTTKKVYITFEVNRNKILIKIRDEGDGFNHKEVKDSTAPENLMKTKGRGLLYMKSYYDSVTYNEKGNEVTLLKERKPYFL